MLALGLVLLAQAAPLWNTATTSRVVGTHMLIFGFGGTDGDHLVSNQSQHGESFPFLLANSTRRHGMIPDHFLRAESVEVGDGLPPLTRAPPVPVVAPTHSQQHLGMRLRRRRL